MDGGWNENWVPISILRGLGEKEGGGGQEGARVVLGGELGLGQNQANNYFQSERAGVPYSCRVRGMGFSNCPTSNCY